MVNNVEERIFERIKKQCPEYVNGDHEKELINIILDEFGMASDYAEIFDISEYKEEHIRSLIHDLSVAIDTICKGGS